MEGLVPEQVSSRYKTLPKEMIDDDYIGQSITEKWKKGNDDRAEFLERREEYTANWRDLTRQGDQGPWENSSNFKIPLTLSMGKAIHARLWQLFSDFSNLFGVKARKEVFEQNEGAVKDFMQFMIESYANDKNGTKDVFDEWIWDNVFDGSGYLKLYFQRNVHTYLEVEPVVDAEETLTFETDVMTGQVISKKDTKTTMRERDVVKEEIVETPQIKRILMEDFLLPTGQSDPQTSEWAQHRIFMTDDQLKARAHEGKFYRDEVEEVLAHKSHYAPTQGNDQIKTHRNDIDGYCDQDGYFGEYHAILEYYGKCYVTKEGEYDDAKEDIDELPQEIVAWVHQASGELLGWTYLYRISPNGIRPIFKSDFIHFPDRSTGVGVGEVLQSTQQAVDATYNLRQDNGTLSSMPFGVYRSSSGLKPEKIQIAPGSLYPVDDVNDIRIIQIPFMSGYGYQEEDRLNSYAERTLNISDLNLGRTPNKVGMFRTASGSAAVQQETSIQLEIHYDRIARTLSKLFETLFIMCRERVPAELFYRITGENGQSIFGKVSRESLKGSYDFIVNVDVLGESRIEGQQKATMMMQTLLNPAFMQTGIVSPSNLYHLAKNFLVKNKVKRIDNFISPPPQYSGEVVTPSERVFRIVVNNYTTPPVESTVRLEENHEQALAFYEGFKQSDEFGLITKPEQLAALQRVIAAHNQLMMAQQAGGNPNMAGMQTPRDGMAPMEAGGTDQGTLGAPMGEVNGPVF